MSTKFIAASVALGALALAGCSSGAAENSAEPIPTVTVSTTVTVTPEPEVVASVAPERKESSRGNLIKTVGDPFGYANPDDPTDSFGSASFAVTGMSVGDVCTNERHEAPVNGHFLRIDIEGETQEQIKDSPTGHFGIGGFAWKVIGSDGYTFNGDLYGSAAQFCLTEAEKMPYEIGPSEQIRASVLLDVPTESGVVILEEANGGTWEWEYPAP